MTDEGRVKPGQLAGRNVRRVRQQRGVSQRWLVKRMRELRFSWHQTTVQGIETGTRPVSIDELVALAVCFDTDLASLLDPVAAGVGAVDVGLKNSVHPSMFRELIPIPWEQDMLPRRVEVAFWDEDKPSLEAGEAMTWAPHADDPLETIGRLERQVRELMERRTGHEG